MGLLCSQFYPTHPIACSLWIMYGPFRTYYNRALDGWMRANPSKTAGIYHRFLRRIWGITVSKKSTFVFKEKNEASFPQSDVLHKLPQPKTKKNPPLLSRHDDSSNRGLCWCCLFIVVHVLKSRSNYTELIKLTRIQLFSCSYLRAEQLRVQG